MSDVDASLVPLSICVHALSRVLEVEWCDATRSLLTHRELRFRCKCAACEQARRAGQCVMPAGDIAITDVSPVGASALRLFFSDGHDRGIFPFAYLRELGEARPRPNTVLVDTRASLGLS